MAAFTPGDLVIYRVGTGSGALTSAATAVFLDEYRPDGTLVQSIALPTADNANNQTLTASGTATSEGLLTLSADGHHLVLTGYDAAPGTASVAGTTSASVNRVVGSVDAAGNVDTTTTINAAFSGNNIRGATSVDGTHFWVTGATSGVEFVAQGSSSAGSAISTTFTNLRAVEIFDGQLYVSSGSSTLRLGTVGAGEPTTSGQTTTNLPGFPTTGSPYEFFFADLSAAVPGVDTLYVADDSLGIEKFSLVGGTWVANGAVEASGAYRGLTGGVSGTTVTLYATGNGSHLDALTDASGYNATLTGTPTVLVNAPANEAFRGVAFAPVAADTTPPHLSSSSPADNATGVAPGDNIVLTFDEAVTAGSGNIVISDGAGDVRTIAVTDSSQVTISGNTVTINPTADLHSAAAYDVTIASGVITDTSGNAFAGIAQDALDFTVGDTTPPTLTSATPADNATIVAAASNIVLTFSEAVKAGSGSIVISDGAGDVRTIAITDTTEVTISGNTVTINPTADLHSGTAYDVTIASGVITDTAGNAFAGIAQDALDFTVGDTTPPTLTSATPADNATNVAAASNIVLTFSEAIKAGSGSIVVSDGAGDVRTIAITDTTQVTISGNTVTINPTADLHSGTAYDVTIASGVITDTAGN